MANWYSNHREGIRDLFTLILIGITGLLAFATYLQLGEAGKLQESTNKLLYVTTNSTVQLGKLIDESNQLLVTLNKGLIETAYQTSLQTYNAGKPFSTEIGNCKFNTNSSKTTHNIFILDSTGNPTTVDFRVVAYYWFYTTSFNGSSLQTDKPIFFERNNGIVGPDSNPPYEVDLSYLLNSTKTLDRSYLYIEDQLTYNPYFAPLGANISGPNNSTLHLLIGFEKDKNTDEWKKITSNINSAC